MARTVRFTLPAHRRIRPTRTNLTLTVVGLLVVAAVATYAQPGYDARFALAWGRDLVHGHGLWLATPSAPTPHPLSVLTATLTGWLPAATTVRLAGLVSGLAAGTVLACVFWLIRHLGSSRTQASLATVCVVVCAPFALLAMTSGNDLPYAALALLGGCSWLQQRPRRAIALLTAASLLRPEALALAAVVALRERTRDVTLAWGAAALVTVAGWVGIGLLAGDPLAGWRTASNNATTNSNPTGLTHALTSTLPDLTSLAGIVVTAAGALAALAWWALTRHNQPPTADHARRLTLLAAAGACTYLVEGLLGTPLVSRYLLYPALLLLILAFASTTPLLTARRRHRAGLAGTLVAVLLLGTAALSSADDWRDLRDARATRARALADAHHTLNSAPVCTPTAAAVRSPALVPVVALETGLPLRAISVADTTPEHGLLLQPLTLDAALLAGFGPSAPLAQQAHTPQAGHIDAVTTSWARLTLCPTAEPR